MKRDRLEAEILDGVLRQTSGSPCDSAHGRLGDHVDGLLDPLDRELVAGHLAHCDDCSELARVIARVQDTLPQLAEMDPGPDFLVGVLDATSRRPAIVDRWAARISETWRGLLQRPRIAWEGAYVGTFVLVLLFGTPTSPFARVPQQALEMAAVNPVAELRPGVGEAWRWVDGRVENTSREVRSEVASQSSTLIERIKRDLGTFWERVTSEQETQETQDKQHTRETAQGENE